jgi:hypothetical protein
MILLKCFWASVLLASVSASAAAAQPVTQVMIVGVFHMSNPGRDLHNLEVDDVLAPKRQDEIQTITESLAQFRPTKIAVEWPEEMVRERYAKYLSGTLPPSRSEVVQLGFRLAKERGGIPVYGIDVPGDMPFQQLIEYAKRNAFSDLLARIDASAQKSVTEEQHLLKTAGIAAALRFLNSPAQLRLGQSWYRDYLAIGSGEEQPGVELMAAWYRRNFTICAKLMQLAKPGDRIVVFFGAGHAYQLRQCVSEATGFELVDPEQYLPKPSTAPK